MGLKGNKSKMGSMLGVDLNVVAMPPVQETPTLQEEKKVASKTETPKQTKTTSAPAAEEPKKNPGGRPRFDVVAGKEMKMSFHCPMPLYGAIIRAAANEMKTNKQLICEILFDALTKKYGQVIVPEEEK